MSIRADLLWGNVRNNFERGIIDEISVQLSLLPPWNDRYKFCIHFSGTSSTNQSDLEKRWKPYSHRNSVGAEAEISSYWQQELYNVK